MGDETKMSVRLGVLLAAGALAIWALASQAQVIDADACQKACERAHIACVDACSDEDNPVECEERCDDQMQECLSGCE
jgi:hypothetical protein